MPLQLSKKVLEEARTFFEERGSQGLEGTALIAVSQDTERLIIPDQLAFRDPGHRVEVTTKGKLELAAALRAGEHYASRIHSHPDAAFHSNMDNANPALTFEGALSIVVPYYGLGLRHGLASCAVLQLRHGEWHDLPPGVDRDRVIVQHDE